MHNAVSYAKCCVNVEPKWTLIYECHKALITLKIWKSFRGFGVRLVASYTIYQHMFIFTSSHFSEENISNEKYNMIGLIHRNQDRIA